MGKDGDGVVEDMDLCGC